MGNKIYTVFQNLEKTIGGKWNNSENSIAPKSNTYDMTNSSDVIFRTKDKAEFLQKKLELKQQKYLSNMWRNTSHNLSMNALNGLSAVKMMYRDVELMSEYPEIGAALDLYADEACLSGETQIKLVNGQIYSIQELYEQGIKNFTCKTVDIEGHICNTNIEKVIKKNEQFEICEIFLEDGSSVKCTLNHRFLTSTNMWVEAQDLMVNDLLMAINNETTHIQTNRIIKIELQDELTEVYDLVNSSINNSFAIKTNNGYIISHNCAISSKGTLINVYSQSDRIKSIIEDLLVNRLDIQVTAPMIIRAMCKYGNQFMLLNINNDKGVVGWRQLPVSEIERREDGMQNMYTTLTNNTSEETTTFTWVGAQQSVTDFRNWQVGHFRLLTDSVFLPYGVSLLNKARRHWRILSLMEDMMLIYRLERSIERRVYKIYVGAIDDADVPAYIEEIANNFKRTPIIDPMTGQIDLRKNILPVWRKTPIPLIDGRTITIEDLADEFANGKTNYVYSVQDSSLKNTIGKVVWCGKNYTAKTMLRIWIDNKFYMVMAHEHEVILRNGAKKRADMLKIGDRLLSFLLDDCCHYNSLCDTVTKIEEIEGDDVYCMTVEGENHEQDRHNFGLQLFSEGDIPVNEGVYVSNCTDQDVFIPVRDPNTPNPIDTLAAAQNLTAIDDIKYIQNKVLAGLRIPKSFLNFEESTGDGKNLALMDVRFARVIVRIQQAFLMELTKIVTIHLYLLGFKDDLTNFTLSMNNPSTQAEQLELENLSKKITTVRDAVSDPGNGLPVMSMTRALKEIMKWSDSEIKANLEEIRLEKALSAEIEKTSQIIKRTGLFDTVDKIYGEPGAEYQEDQGGMMDNGQGNFAGGGSGGLGGGFGDDLNTAGDIGSDDSGDLSSVEGTEPTSDMNNNGEALPTSNNNQPMESKRRNRMLIEHQAFDNLIAKIDNTIKLNEQQKEITINKKLLMNDKYSEIIQDLDKFTK